MSQYWLQGFTFSLLDIRIWSLNCWRLSASTIWRNFQISSVVQVSLDWTSFHYWFINMRLGIFQTRPLLFVLQYELKSKQLFYRPYPHSNKQWRQVEVRVDKSSKCTKMCSPTSLWCYCSHAMNWNAGRAIALSQSQWSDFAVITIFWTQTVWFF